MYSIQQHLKYSAWGAAKIAEILNTTDDALWDKDLISSFPSIRKTIYHVWDAETVWFERITGSSPTDWPSKSLGPLNREEFLRMPVEHAEKMVNYFADKDRDYLESKITYKTMKGVECVTPIEEILFHVVNHGTFHRGQLVTMLRNLGVTQLQSTDLIAYLRL